MDEDLSNVPPTDGEDGAKDNNNEVEGSAEKDPIIPATGKILSSVLCKDFNMADANGNPKARDHCDPPRQSNGGGHSQSVIRSLKSERSNPGAASPSPPPHHDPVRISPNRNAANNPAQAMHSHTNSTLHHQTGPIHHSQQRESPFPSQSHSSNPSQQHVTVLVNASRVVKAEQPQAVSSQAMIQQHHQTTIVGIRRNSPPASSAPFQMGQPGNNFRDGAGLTPNGNNFTSAMMQVISPQNQTHLQLLHNPSGLNMRNNNQSPSQTNGNGTGHSLLAAAAQGQLQMPLQLLQQQQQQHQHQMRIKRERSPIHSLQGATVQGTAMNATPGGQQNMLGGKLPTMSQMPLAGQNMLRNPRDAAILLRVKNELPNMSQQQRMVWNATARINGVKPEIIGGPLPNIRPNGSTAGSPPQSASQTPPRSTPTVIMGESCGVRTMVWGFEPTSSSGQMPPSPASSSSNQSSGSGAPSQNNEEAAQLLLSLGQGAARSNEIRPRVPIQRSPHPLNMERLWAGDYSQLPAGQQLHALNLSQPQWMGGGGTTGGLGSQGNKSEHGHGEGPQEEDDQPLVCMICEDKATGLHYGIITCEGCKGFFKRTVQNRRVYTCVADGTCEITKAQRNRCQYCRFKKCIEQGMVLQAVREDRMPGGRNSGAVYNLYKVKYKKHKKVNQKPGTPQPQPLPGQMQSPSNQLMQQTPSKMANSGEVAEPKSVMFVHQGQGGRTKAPSFGESNSNHSTSSSNSSSLPAHLINGTILKTALMNPSEIVHLRHRIDNAVSSSKDRSVNYDHALCMIQTLMDCDEMENIATLPHFPEFLEDKSEIGDKLCNIGDSIVHKLVSWTKKLPFYLEIPVEIHTKLLTDKWHELLVLTTAAYQALHGKRVITSPEVGQAASKAVIGPIVPEKGDPEFVQEVNNHLCTLQTCLTTLMGQPISMEQLRLDVGHMVEKMTQITIMFRRIKLKMEEYVCLKVYILLNKGMGVLDPSPRGH